MKQCFVNHWLHCPYCGVDNKDELVKNRNGRCCNPNCKKLIPISNVTIDASIEGEEVMDNIKAIGIAMSNNEIGQTISTIELLARHGSDTIDLQNLRSELLLEQRSRRLEEEKKARVERSNTLLALKDWISTDAIANSLVDMMEEAGRQPSFDDAKELWGECLRGIHSFIRGNLA